MILVYQILLLIAAIAIGGIAISRNSYRHTARHWDYIASRLRIELHAAHNELDKYGPADASTTLAERIRSLARRLS